MSSTIEAAATHTQPDGRRYLQRGSKDKAYAIRVDEESDNNTAVHPPSRSANNNNNSRNTARQTNNASNDDTVQQTISNRRSSTTAANATTTTTGHRSNNKFNSAPISRCTGTSCITQDNTPPNTTPNNKLQQTIPKSCQFSIANDKATTTTGPTFVFGASSKPENTNKSLLINTTPKGGTSALPTTSKKRGLNDLEKKSTATASGGGGGRSTRRCRRTTTTTTQHKQVSTTSSLKYPPSQHDNNTSPAPFAPQSPNKGKGVGGRDKPRRFRLKEGAVEKGNVQKDERAPTIDNDNDMLGRGRRSKRKVRRRSGGKSKTPSKGSSLSKPPSLSTAVATSLQQVVPQPQLPIGRDPSRPVEPIPQIDEKLDKALQTHTQSIHQIIERGEVYNLPSHELLEKELQTPATLEEIKSISSDNHFGKTTSMVVERLGTKSLHFKQDNHTHKSVNRMIQKVAALRKLRPLIGSKITQEEHAKMCLDVSNSNRSNFAAGLSTEARAVLNMGAPANHRNSRFHNQNYTTTKEFALLTVWERLHNNGCRRQSCCPLTMNCLIPMFMKELAGDKCLSKFQLSLDHICQGDNWWFALDNDDGSQAAFKRIIARQALAFCGCSYHEVFVVSLLDLAVKLELCLTVYGVPGMTLISSVYATDLKLFDTRMKEMNLYSAVCTLLMLYPHMENLITERVIVMYNEEHLVKLDECILEFLGPLLGIDKVFPVISQWRAENMPPGASKELRKIKLALLEKARAVLKETRRVYKAGEELTPKQQKTIAKLDKMYQDARDLWKRYKNGVVLPIDEEVRINAILDALTRGRDTMDKAWKAVKAGTADDDEQDMVDRQQKGITVTMDKARKAVKAGTADDKQQDSVDRQDEGIANGRANRKGAASTRRLHSKIDVLRSCSNVAKLQCIRTDGCGEFQYFDLSKKKSNKIQTVGATFVFGKGSQRSMACGCSSKHIKWKLIENMTAGSIAKDLAELKATQKASKKKKSRRKSSEVVKEEDTKPPAKKSRR